MYCITCACAAVYCRLTLFFIILLKDLSSCTDSSESSGSCEDEDSEECHEDVDELLEDVAGDEPLPEPTRHQSSVQKLTTLIQWLIYFFLFWQASTKLSDNGLEWLLWFLFQFLHITGVTFNCEYLCQLALMLPS